MDIDKEREQIDHAAAAAPRLQWCCTNGCGPCGIKAIDYEVSRTETLEGELIARETVPHLVSVCCSAPMFMWDNQREQVVYIPEGA